MNSGHDDNRKLNKVMSVQYLIECSTTRKHLVMLDFYGQHHQPYSLSQGSLFMGPELFCFACSTFIIAYSMSGKIDGL